MITLCWGAKGGSGVTTVAATIALARHRPTLLLDLDGDLALALGLGRDDDPALDDWFASDAPADRVERLARRLDEHVRIVPARRRIAPSEARHADLVGYLAAAPFDVVVDAGTGAPPPPWHDAATRSLLVTRPCYLALTRAQHVGVRPHGVIVVREPGRSLGERDIAAAIGAPIVATLEYDPKIARAVDSGLAVSRLPIACLRELREAA